eukprot:gene11406-11554_t
MAAQDAVVEGVAGAIGAVIALTSTYPLLTVSTLRALELKDSSSGEKQLQGRLRFLPGPVRDVIEFTRQHSWRALFAGLKPAVAATAASQGIYHTVYSVLRQWAVARKMAAMQQQARGAPGTPHQLQDGGKSVGISVGASMLVASVAGCVNVLLTNPIWVVITQMQALQRHKQNAGTLAVARQVYRDHGVAGFFKGLMPSMVMVVNPTIQYILYESLVARALELRRSAASHRRHSRGKAAPPNGMVLGPLDIFLLSAIAKIGATLVTYPMLVVKNRLQRMLADEGVAAFYKGMRVKLLQTVLAAALLMMLKEEIFVAVRSAIQPHLKVQQKH